jgi:hypothetical protein
VATEEAIQVKTTFDSQQQELILFFMMSSTSLSIRKFRHYPCKEILRNTGHILTNAWPIYAHVNGPPPASWFVVM